MKLILTGIKIYWEKNYINFISTHQKMCVFQTSAQIEIRAMEESNKMNGNNFCWVNSDCFSEDLNFKLSLRMRRNQSGKKEKYNAKQRK